MIKSAAIVKTKTLAPWKELRLQKRKLKKSQAAKRKAIKQIRPSPIGSQIIEVPEVPNVVEQIEVVEADLDSPPTREEMLQQSDKIGLVVNKHWSNATLLKHINDAMGI